METIYYVYDPKTFKYAGMATFANRPDNATDVKPVAVLNGVEYPLQNAIFDPTTKTWSGDNASYQIQKQLALLTKMVMAQNQQIVALTKQLATK